MELSVMTAFRKHVTRLLLFSYLGAFISAAHLKRSLPLSHFPTLCVGDGIGEDLKSKPAVTTASKKALRQSTFMEIRALVRPRHGEWRWDEIPWYTDLWAARRAAALEDKPLL